MNEQLLEYYAGDELAASVWQGKYALKERTGAVEERTPMDMHTRMAKEFFKLEHFYSSHPTHVDLSELGRKTQDEWRTLMCYDPDIFRAFDVIMGYLDRYKYIIPQGSIMSMLGNQYVVGSLSNCFVIPPPADSYGGIMKTDQELVQLAKRRGGVGTHLNTLRPDKSRVQNAAGTSTGSHSFMPRFSNSIREVAQNGRRGALMLLMSVKHPDIFRFVTKKADLTQVTGANVSTMLTDEFMRAVESDDDDFLCRFPIETSTEVFMTGKVSYVMNPKFDLNYNELTNYTNTNGENVQVMKIHAKELFDLIVEMAWSNGEPGLAFMDRIVNYCPEGVYDKFRPIASNPCGEQWMQAYDACRLLALNLFSIVVEPYTPQARIDYDKLYEIAYVQQRLADDIVDLEIEAIVRIIDKIEKDPEDPKIKATELEMWKNIKDMTSASRRTGCGFTALGDMLAALGIKYDSQIGLDTVEQVMRTKMRGELDSTIDMAIMRGSFIPVDILRSTEFTYADGKLEGVNDFGKMICSEFPEQASRMYKYGRRNASWSTLAPTGTVSIVALLNKYANTTAGGEPAFSVFHFRNKKVNPSDTDVRVDYVDQNGDSWMTYPVLMGGFREWIDATCDVATFIGIDNLNKEQLEELYKKSPYYGSCANDIDWKRRIDMQAVIQKYTTNAISSTLNLPKDVKKETVAEIYRYAWKKGLKGVTVYRDGCRDGVMNLEKKSGKIETKEAVSRPKELPAQLHVVKVKGVKYCIIVGMMDDKPYEIFAFECPAEIKADCSGTVIKAKSGHYHFKCDDVVIKDIQDKAVHKEEGLVTRLLSGLLRHGATAKFVMDQVDKAELEIPTFGKAVSRILKKYCDDDEILKGAKCENCGSTNIALQEGCKTCQDCGQSRCG